MSNKVEMRATPVSEKTMKKLTRNVDKMKENPHLITTGENITNAAYDMIKDKKYIDYDELMKALQIVGVDLHLTLEAGIISLWKSRGLTVDGICFKSKGHQGIWTISCNIKEIDNETKACPNCNSILTVTYDDKIKNKIVDFHCDHCGLKGGIPNIRRNP